MAWTIDRLGRRSLIDLLGTIQALEARGVDLYLGGLGDRDGSCLGLFADSKAKQCRRQHFRTLEENFTVNNQRGIGLSTASEPLISRAQQPLRRLRRADYSLTGCERAIPDSKVAAERISVAMLKSYSHSSTRKHRLECSRTVSETKIRMTNRRGGVSHGRHPGYCCFGS